MIRARKEYQRLQAFYEEALNVLAQPGLSDAVPAVSAWSPAHHLHHVAAINTTILENLLAVCRGEAPPSLEGGARAVGLLVLATGRMPRGRGRTPARFAPPAAVTRDDLEALLARSHAALEALEMHLDGLARLPGRWRHPVFGWLDARQMLRFVGIHARHHLAIIHDIDTRRPAMASGVAVHPEATL